MGYAIGCGIVKNKVLNKNSIVFLEKSKQRISFLKKEGFIVYNNWQRLRNKEKKSFGAITLAVKPNQIKDAINELKLLTSKNLLFISIAAGIKIQQISILLNKNQPIARVMPNTPCKIGQGMSVITYNKSVKREQKLIVKKIFNSLGKVTELNNEDKMDLVTALSGSGPAYFCLLIEQLTNSGIKLGLSEKVSHELSMQTALGTLLLLSEKKLSPTLLREMVTSKKGTTEAALKTLKKLNFDKIIFKAIKAAMDRAKELGNE